MQYRGVLTDTPTCPVFFDNFPGRSAVFRHTQVRGSRGTDRPKFSRPVGGLSTFGQAEESLTGTDRPRFFLERTDMLRRNFFKNALALLVPGALIGQRTEDEDAAPEGLTNVDNTFNDATCHVFHYSPNPKGRWQVRVISAPMTDRDQRCQRGLLDFVHRLRRRK